MWVYLYQSWTEKELKNAYIGEYEFVTKYQEVEYIQSSWTQYIDTWFTPNSTSKVIFKISNFTINSSTQYIYWTYSTRWNNMFSLLWNSTWQWWTNWELCFWSTQYSLTSWNLWNWWTHTWEVSSNWFYLDWTKIVSVSWTFSWANSMTLFAWHMNTNIWFHKGSFKLYYFKIYENWTLVRDFVPCYRKSDSVIWLYDLVNSVFYTNAGTWTFTKWADVN